MARKIDSIIVHNSASSWGNVAVIRQWHVGGNGWDDIGYHHVITNGMQHSKGEYKEKFDGLVQIGRPLEIVGAHCAGYNSTSIGICLIGEHSFTAKQFQNLKKLISTLRDEHNIPAARVFCHSEFSPKTCPNFSPEFLMELVEGRI